MFKKLRDFLFFRENDGHEFKPVLAEIEENPINPIGPVIFWIIITFIFSAAIWRYSSMCARSSLSDCRADCILFISIQLFFAHLGKQVVLGCS